MLAHKEYDLLRVLRTCICPVCDLSGPNLTATGAMLVRLQGANMIGVNLGGVAQKKYALQKSPAEAGLLSVSGNS